MPVEQIESLNAQASVFGLDILDVGAANNYLTLITRRNERNIYRTSSASSLTNVNEGFMRLNSFASTSKHDILVDAN